MNRNVSIITGLVVIIVVAAGIFLYSKNQNSTGKTNSSEVQTASSTSEPAASSPSEIQGSMTDLLAVGGDRKCEWSGETAGQVMSGIVYTSNKKFRSEVKSTVKQIGEITAYSVGDGTKITVWTSLAPNQKTTISYDNLEKPATATGSQKDFNQFAQKFNYRCSPWNVDNNLFTVQ